MVEKQRVNPVVAAAVLCAALIYSGLVGIRERHRFRCLLPPERICTLRGRIVSDPVRTAAGDSYRCRFEPERAAAENGAAAGCRGRTAVFLPARTVEAFFPGKLYSVGGQSGAALYSTGCRVEIRGSFSRTGDSFYAGSCGPSEYDENAYGRLCRFRALCRLQFRRLMYAWGEAGGLLLALLSGIREYTARDTAEAFRNAGLAHILALSGMHLSLFSGLFALAGERAGGRRLSGLLRLCAVLAFTWFAGFSPSLRRAFLCAVILLLSSACGVRPPDMKGVLALSFLIHAAAAPEELRGAAFMLSYGALAGILVAGGVCGRLARRFLPAPAAEQLASGAAANLCTAPISARLFGRFAPAGIVASVVVSPAVTLFIWCGLAGILLCLCFPVCVRPAAFFMNVLYAGISGLVRFFARIPGVEI